MKYRRWSLKKVMALNKFLKSECLCIFYRMHVLINAVANFPNIQQQCSLWKMFFFFPIWHHWNWVCCYIVSDCPVLHTFVSPTLISTSGWLRFMHISASASYAYSYLELRPGVMWVVQIPRQLQLCEAAPLRSAPAPPLCLWRAASEGIKPLSLFTHQNQNKWTADRRTEELTIRRRQGFKRHQQEFKVMKLF